MTSEVNSLSLRQGDCIAVMRAELSDCSVDAIVTDPPYGLGFMGKEWDQLPPGREWAAECLRVLKPGAYLAAFGSSRTVHRLACAVEDAGLEIVDSLAWLYGSGRPKGKGRLKPAHDPIVLARRPGLGGLNVDSCRVGPRWPPNVALDEAVAAELDAQTGVLTSGKMRAGVSRKNRSGWHGPMPVSTGGETHGDRGGASRFFPVFRYEGRAPARERPKIDGQGHVSVKPLGLMRWLVRLLTPPGGLVLDTFAGSGTTAEACALEGFACFAIDDDPFSIKLARQRLGIAEGAS